MKSAVEAEDSRTHLLLELLMDRVQRILDGDSSVVACSDLQTQWEVEVNFLYRWVA